MRCVVSSAPLFCHRNTRRMDSQEVGEELSVNLCPLPDPSQDPVNLLKESKEDHPKGFSDVTCLPLSRWERAVIFWTDMIKPSCWRFRHWCEFESIRCLFGVSVCVSASFQENLAGTQKNVFSTEGRPEPQIFQGLNFVF